MNSVPNPPGRLHGEMSPLTPPPSPPTDTPPRAQTPEVEHLGREGAHVRVEAPGLGEDEAAVRGDGRFAREQVVQRGDAGAGRMDAPARLLELLSVGPMNFQEVEDHVRVEQDPQPYFSSRWRWWSSSSTSWSARTPNSERVIP